MQIQEKIQKKIHNTKSSSCTEILILCLCVTAVLFVIWSFNGQWPWKAQPYNSYILQAQSWLQGRLDLGRDYPYLELAIFNNKYYVSFPPFPSYLMIPFVALGWNSCDSMLAFASSMAGAAYAFMILKHFNIDSKRAFFYVLFITVGSNWLMTAHNAWVWFIAQNMAFTFSLMAIYYALKNKAGFSLLFWACAVGCRPFNALYIFVLLYLLYMAHKKQNPQDNIIAIIKKRYMALIPMLIIAISYMILNFARFGNIVEFGHNYLPEFTRTTTGQFNVSYLKDNITNLFRLPSVKTSGALEFPAANGMCLFIASPIFFVYLIMIIKGIVSKTIPDKKLIIISAAVIVLELLCIVIHKTMGGSHFGNRYTNDVLPLVFLSIASLLGERRSYEMIFGILFFFGLCLNLVGSTVFYLNIS